MTFSHCNIRDILWYVLLSMLMNSSLLAQNLVPNGSFEELSNCPQTLDQLELATGWSNARGTCDFFQVCGPPGVTGVPSNSLAYQEALNGDGYAAFLMYVSTQSIEDYREHLVTTLSEPLNIGETYYFSMYLSRGFQEVFHNKASNGQSMMLSTVPFDSYANPSPLFAEAHIVNYEVLEDTSAWVQVKGSVLADQAYQYLLIGCFLVEGELDTANTYGLPDYGAAYYLLDEVRLSTDSIYAYEPLVTSTSEYIVDSPVVYPNPFQNDFDIQTGITARRYELSDSRGELVRSASLVNQNTRVTGLGRLSPGLYILSIYYDNGESSHVRMVKY